MAIYVDNKQIISISIGGGNNPSMFVDNKQVFPDGYVYTYALTDIAVKYSSNSYLLPNGSNYAYVEGTFVTYRNGSVYETKKVVCNPTFRDTNDIIIKKGDGNYYWNYDKYKTTSKPYTSLYITKATYDSYSYSKNIIMSAGSNTDYNFLSATINTFKVGGYDSPHAFSSIAQSLPMYVKGTRKYGWTSGIEAMTMDTIAQVFQTNLQARIVDMRQTQGREAYYEIINNGNQAVTITAYLEDYASWWDYEHQMQDEDTEIDSETYTIQPGESITTRNLKADALKYAPSGTDDKPTYYIVIGRNTYSLKEDKSWISVYDSISDNEYFNFEENVTFISLDGMMANLTATNTQRSGIFYVYDKLDSTSRKGYTLSQTAPSYTFAFYGSDEVEAMYSADIVAFVVQSYNDSGPVRLTTSNVTVGYGATCTSVTAGSNNRYTINISVPKNDSSSQKIYEVTITQPTSGKRLEGTITQAANPSPSTYVLEMYNGASPEKTVRATSTATTFNIVASPAITTSNCKCLGCTVASITNNSGYQTIRLTYKANTASTISTLALENDTVIDEPIIDRPIDDGTLTIYHTCIITNGDKKLILSIEHLGSSSGGLVPII